MRDKIGKLKPYRKYIIGAGILSGLVAVFFLINPGGKLGDHPHQEAAQAEADKKPVNPNSTWEYPAGGREILPKYRLVALYGSPETHLLGSLGEQNTAKSIARIKKFAKEYQKYSEETVYPAFEVITTVASAGAGADGDYSRETPIKTLRPLINAAKKEGVYIVLDLQPGHSSFLKQAKRYEELLKEPHVGLALDPEWRLKKGQKHLVQVGSVKASEINQTAEWLAQLTRDNELPQKLFLLHQFKLKMIENRETLETTKYPELAWLIQMDGLGNQGVKQETWRTIRNAPPKNIYWGWKNFYDEDEPMLNPKQTYQQVKPKPYFVSYQ